MEKVIFDTNAYRYLVNGKSNEQIEKLVQKIKNKEKENNIETLISSIVAKELLAHVAHKTDPSYQICLNAIKALYLHSENAASYDILASHELLISKIFFDKILPSRIETINSIGEMLYLIANTPTEKTFTRIRQNLLVNKKHVFETEISFAKEIKKFVDKIDPVAKSWQIFADNEPKRKELLAYIRSENFSFVLALGYISKVHESLVFSGQIPMLTNEEISDRVKEFMKIFPEPIALYKEIMENLVNSEFNILEDNRANFVWDIHLMFNIGNHSINGSKLYFVTDDKAIIRNAIKGNEKYSILTYDEYVEYLKNKLLPKSKK